MANQYEEQVVCWKSLENNKRIVPLELWEVFDSLFTDNVTEANEIFTDNNFKISRTHVAIIVGLMLSSGAFLEKIKRSVKNELDGNGVLTFDSDISELTHHLLGNDLNTITMITENIPLTEIPARRETIEKAFREIFEVINKIKILTKE